MGNKILVVDDDESILDALTLILEDEHYDVQATSKGTHIYKKVDSYKPNLILLDVLMSGTDGREICKNLKSNPGTREIPIVMISAHPSAQKSIQECGANDFLAKPFETIDLLKKLAKHL